MDSDNPLMGALKMLLYWALSIAVVIGPYFAILYGVPALFEEALGNLGSTGEGAVERLRLGLNTHYWWVMLVYLIAAGLITPRWDPDNLGLFGSPWIDNPFSFEDDYNRTMRNVALFLFPGKLVWFTVECTGRMILSVFRKDDW